MKTLYLCGAGNSEGVRLALRVQERQGRWDRIVLLDDDPDTHGRRLLGVEVAGPFSLLADAGEAEAVNLVARTTRGRRAARRRIEGFGVDFMSLIHPEVDTLGARLDGDQTVYQGVTLAPEVEMAPGSVVFMGAVVGHESTVGRGCVIAANAVLNARVELGDGVYVGTNATVLPEIRIGAGATVGAGSVVVRDVPPGVTVLGVPARAIPAPGSAAGSAAGHPATTGPDPRPTDPSASVGNGTTTAASAGEKEMRATLAGIWSQVLERPEVDPTVNFFDLGGTSLGALQVVQRIQEATGMAVDVVDLFRCPTIEALARELSGSVEPKPRSVATRSPGPGDLASTVAGVFEDVLGVRGVRADTSFTELGGTSVDARAACTRLGELTGVGLCHMYLERFPTPRRLADYMDSLVPGVPPPCPAAPFVRRQIQHEEFHRRGLV